MSDPLMPAAHGRPASARIDDVEQSLVHDRSYKVRVDAALILGQLHQERSVPALITALRDAHPAVRATAARALGQIGNLAARAPLARAQQDGNGMVRRFAREAQKAIDQRELADREAARRQRARPAFDVKLMADRTRKATPALRGHMRDVLTNQLRAVGDVADPPQQASFVIDGVINDLSTSTRGDSVEVRCAVQLVVSRGPDGGVFLLTNGESIVQKPRHQWSPQQHVRMEMDAVESAVRGASQDLVQNLANQQ